MLTGCEGNITMCFPDWSGAGQKNQVSGSGAVSGGHGKRWSVSGARNGGSYSENGAGSRTYKKYS